MLGLRVPAALLAAGAVCACGAPGSDQLAARPPVPAVPAGPTTGPTAAPTAGPPDIRFTPCPGGPPSGPTRLRPASVKAGATKDAYTPADATVTVEGGGELHLPDGRVATGNGYEAATAGASRVLEVAGGAVTAHVSLAYYDDRVRWGRRVAFVELALPGGDPVSWAESDAPIVTDGGFVPPGAPVLEAQEDASEVDAYVDAFSAGGGRHLCVHRRSAGGLDAVLFATGIGDGFYPVYLGRDAADRVVSVVFHGGLVPWAKSGLPGTSPV